MYQSVTLNSYVPVRDVARRISEIVTANDTTTYSGIIAINNLFTNGYNAEERMLALLTGEDNVTRRNNKWAAMMRHIGDNLADTEANIVTQMDWFQMFVLKWVPIDIIDRITNSYSIPSNRITPVPNPMPYTQPTLEAVVTCYDTLLCIAIAMYEDQRNLNNRTQSIANMDETLTTARDFIAKTTREHDGCDAGKRDFLNGTGLWDEDEVDEMFSREYNIYIDVSMRVCLTREIPGGHDADDWANDEISESDVDQAVRDFVQFDSVDWSVSEVEPS